MGLLVQSPESQMTSSILKGHVSKTKVEMQLEKNTQRALTSSHKSAHTTLTGN